MVGWVWVRGVKGACEDAGFGGVSSGKGGGEGLERGRLRLSEGVWGVLSPLSRPGPTL